MCKALYRNLLLFLLIAALQMPVYGNGLLTPFDYSIYPHLDRVDYIPGETYAVEAFSLWGADYFAVANEVSGLGIYQVAGGEAIQVGVEHATGSERDVAVVDWFAYVATGNQGLSRMSVAVPDTPIETDFIILPGLATRVAASSTHAFVACGTGGLVVVDVTNPGTMYNVGGYGTDVTAVCLDGNRLGVVNSGKFEILDITAPAVPALLGTYSAGAGVSYIDAVLQGDLAYVINHRQVERLDITTPMAITATDTLRLNDPYYLYRSRLEIEGSEVLVAATGYLGILDFATGSVLRETKQVGVIRDAAIIGGKILTVTEDRLEIYHDGLHENASPTGIFTYDGLMKIQGIMFEDVLYGMAYSSRPPVLVAAEIGGSGGLRWSLDLDMPEEYVYGLTQRGTTVAAITTNGVLRLATVSRYGAILRGSVALTDIDLPQSDRVLAFLDDETLAIVDTGAGELTYNIRIVDIADPDNPAQIGLYPLNMGYAAHVLTSGSLVMAARDNRYEVFDASDRMALQFLAVQDPGSTSVRLYARDSWLYSFHRGSPSGLDGSEHLETWDISDPLNPILSDNLNLPKSGFLVFAGDWAYQMGSGLVLDFSDPGHPAPAGSFSLSNPSVNQMIDVVASREYIVTGWLGDTTNGFAHFLPAHLGTGYVTAVEPLPGIPGAELALRASPNPFNPRVTISFELPAATSARIQVFDLRGRLVADLGQKQWEAGAHSVTWDGVDRQGRNLPSGVYLTRISTSQGPATRKIVLAR